DRRVLEGVSESGVSRRHHGGEIGEGAAGGEDALGLLWEVEEVGDPADDLGFELDQPGGQRGHVDVAVEGAREEVCKGRRVQAAARYVGEVAGAGATDGL